MWKHQAQKCQSVLVWNLQEWELSLWSYGNSRMSGCPDILKQPQIRYPFKSGFGLLTCTSLLLNPPVWRILLCWRVRYATFWMVKHIFFTIFTVNHSKSMVNLLLASEIPPFWGWFFPSLLTSPSAWPSWACHMARLEPRRLRSAPFSARSDWCAITRVLYKGYDRLRISKHHQIANRCT